MKVWENEEFSCEGLSITQKVYEKESVQKNPGGGINCHEFLFEKIIVERNERNDLPVGNHFRVSDDNKGLIPRGLASQPEGSRACPGVFTTIISAKNIFAAWREFQKGKMSKLDVIAFSEKVEENLFDLIADLENGTYAHGQYSRFCVYDPKRREIAKASVRDRVLHHAIHRVLAPKFDPSFIFDSFSSRTEKGTHTAVLRLRKFAQKISKNLTKTVWALQLDIRKFFDSVDHEVLLSLLRKKIRDDKVMGLLEIIVNSFEVCPGKGIPLGNLTSQLFSNVYLDPLDQFVKRKLGVKFYLRYADDSVILSENKIFLESCLLEINSFVIEKLKLELHARKIIFKKWHQGIDFLGYVIFPYHTVLRTRTKRRSFRKMRRSKVELAGGKITKKYFNGVVQSYLGILKHCRGLEIKKEIQKIIKF